MIPDAAVEAASAVMQAKDRHEGFGEYELWEYTTEATAILEAAAPHMTMHDDTQGEKMGKESNNVRCGGGWVCHGTTHIEGCLSGDQLRNAQQIAADVHRDLPHDTEADVAFAEFKRRLGVTK